MNAPDTLKEICDRKRKHLLRKKARVKLETLREQAEKQTPPRGFKQALQAKIQAGQFALIAEIKKASPSRGLIRADFDPKTLAESYAKAGAACLSVLTDEPYFQGRDEYLQQARDVAALPVLRKDFMLEPYQIHESRALGADCVLLIMAALSDTEAESLEALAVQLGMDVLVEVHDAAELARALRILPGNPHKMIGVNNRSLKTLAVDLGVSETLAKDIPEHMLRVCESGLACHADLLRMQKSGFSCFLVGESLMREADLETATRKLLGNA